MWHRYAALRSIRETHASLWDSGIPLRSAIPTISPYVLKVCRHKGRMMLTGHYHGAIAIHTQMAASATALPSSRSSFYADGILYAIRALVFVYSFPLPYPDVMQYRMLHSHRSHCSAIG